MKKIIYYCVLSFKSAPFVFSLNCAYVLVAALARFGVTYSFKAISNYIVSATEISILLYAFLFLLVCNMISGYNGNFNEMLNLLCIKNVKILFYKAFMRQAYLQKQDDFYDSDFYDNYMFVKENIDSALEICVTVWNKLLGTVLTILISALAITVFSPWMLLIMASISSMMIVINRYSVRKKVELNKALISEERKAAYYSDLLSGRQHAKELRIFGLRNVFLEKWAQSYTGYMKEKHRLEQRIITLNKVPGIIQQILSGALTVYFLCLVNSGKMSVGDFTFLFGMMMTLMGEMNNLIDLLSKEIMEKLEYLNAFEKFAGKIEQEANLGTSETAESLAEEEFQTLTVKNLSYSYPNQTGKAIKNISLTIQQGEIVCLLGYNGSGKSTFSKLICGILEDYTGEILINGHNIRNVKKEQIFQKYGIGFQDYTKYSLPLKENIRIGKIEEKSMEPVRKAIKKTGLENLIRRLPEGENTILGKEYDANGQDLSGGQWQKVILARAYMGEPDFFILDEPTAAIDPIEEMKILGEFRTIIQGKTALLISHRIGFARMADRILFMRDGEIVEDGTHDQLLAQKGQYYELFEAQKELYE